MTSLVVRDSRLVCRDESFQIRRVVAEDTRLLVKVPISPHPGVDDARLRHEFAVFHDVGSSLTLEPLRIVERGGRPEAHYEDFDAVPFAPDASEDDELTALLDVSHELTAILTAFHDRGYLLGTLRPGSLLRRASSRELVLADATLSSRLERASSEEAVEAWLRMPHLSHAAPEIVGRAFADLDHRADLYALGTVLYHHVSGHLPFETTSASELVQSHLAKEPPPIRRHAPWLPEAVADVLMRLLEKNPRDRFVNAEAFEQELARAVGAAPLSARRRRVTTAERRSAPPSVPPRRLFGRESAAERLHDKCARTRTAPEIVFVEGDAGVGKTSLLGTLRSHLPRGHLCRGRFAHSGTVAPLSGWAESLRDLATWVLTRSAAETEAWQSRLTRELGESAALIEALSPEWGTLLGSASRSATEIGDGGLQRLGLAIHKVLSCFAEPSAPVVLSFDDLQWADASSLAILEFVMTLPEAVNLLVVAAVRPEAGGTRSAELDALRRRLEAAHVTQESLSLGAWGRVELRELIAGTFEGRLADGEAFVEFLLARAQGNPFYTSELVKSALRSDAFRVDLEAGIWSCDQDRLRGLPPADSVLGFLTRRIASLPPSLSDTLRIAACLGPTFAACEFAAATGGTDEEALARLEPAVTEGLLLVGRQPEPRPAGGEVHFDFAHDRVLEACRALATDDECARLSLKAAQELSKSADRRRGRAHKIAGFFNAARALITEPEALLRGAHLNLEAGLLAKQASAFSQALEYFEGGIDFLGARAPGEAAATSWARAFAADEALCRTLSEEAAEAALQSGKFERMRELCDSVLSHTTSPLERTRAYEVRVGGFFAEQRFPEGVTAACEILRELGVTFPRRPVLAHTILGYIKTRRRILSGPIERLKELPPNDDPRIKAVSRILAGTYSCAYLGHRNLFPLLVYRHLHDSLTHGNGDYSCVTYSGFALVLAGMNDLDSALRLGDVALELLKHPGSERYRAKVYMGYYCFVWPWVRPLRDVIPLQNEGIRSALEFGDFEYAGHLITIHSLTELHTGGRLPELAKQFEQHRAMVQSLRQSRSIILEELLCQLVHDLITPSAGSPLLSGPFYDERAMLPRCLEPLDHNLVFNHHFARLYLALYLDDVETALAAAAAGREFLETGAFALYTSAVFVFTEALACLRAARTERAGRGRLLRRAAKGRKHLARVAKRSPTTFLHKLHLVDAETARVKDQPDRAAFHYERAIELSLASGFVQDTALAQEYAAESYLERGMERLARQYLRECYGSYQRWGATAVTRRLELRYPEHFAVLTADATLLPAGAHPSLYDQPDNRVLFRSVQALSTESRLSGVLEGLLTAMFEHAGAQRALLVIEQRGTLRVVAEADVDRGTVDFSRTETLDESDRLCRSVVQYAARTARAVVLEDAVADDRFGSDPYVVERQPRALLVTPLVHKGRLHGLAYLENRRVSRIFTPARLEVANLLAGQAAAAIATDRYHALELEAQQAKIKPHFLFNTLNTIAELTVRDAGKAEAAVVKLAQLYRYVLETELSERVTLNQELTMVKSYLALEKLRYDPRLEFSIQCEDTVREVKVPGLIIQPLVENSVRYAVHPRLGPGRIWVEAKRVGDRCQLTVLDDGDAQGSLPGGTGFGLRSVRERLALVYGSAFSLTIRRDAGFLVEISLPLEDASAATPD